LAGFVRPRGSVEVADSVVKFMVDAVVLVGVERKDEER